MPFLYCQGGTKLVFQIQPNKSLNLLASLVLMKPSVQLVMCEAQYEGSMRLTKFFKVSPFHTAHEGWRCRDSRAGYCACADPVQPSSSRLAHKEKV